MRKTTRFLRDKDNVRQWHVLDAAGKPLGRLSTRVAHLLMGKHKPAYSPQVDCGDGVVIVNAAKVKLTGNKGTDKRYYRYSGYPGGLKTETVQERLEKHPERILMDSVYGMLPKNKIGKRQLTHLRVCAGENHPHAAQKPRESE